jgi:hypothetical protein
MKSQKIDLSVIIVSYNTKILLGNCLDSVFSSDLGRYSMEVFISDNGSADGTADMVKSRFPESSLIENGNNLGFAKANNIAITKTRGRYVLCLNSDTRVFPETFAAMIRFMDAHPEAGISTCKLVLGDGMIDPACHRGFPTPWNALTYFAGLEKLFPGEKIFSGYHQLYKDMSVEHEIDCCSGAFLMARKETIKSVGFFDEDYFFYAEDIDLAYRIKKAGWQVWYNPAVSVIHFKKRSGRANENRRQRISTEIMFHTYNRLFYRKHYQDKYPHLVNFLVNMFYDFRLLLLKTVGL